MKAKELLYLLGIKPKARSYGSELVDIHLPQDGRVQFAQWLHPRYPRQIVTQESVAMLRRCLAPGDVAIDIGAHTGDSTLPIALAVGATGTVFALEPNRYVFPVLERNAALNHDKTRIVPLCFAATPEDGDFEFEYSDSGFCNGGNHESISHWRHAHAFKLKVEGKNLPAFLQAHFPDSLPRIRFIKVDAEGYDHTILRSLAGLLASNRPFLKAEVFKYTTESSRREFLKFLESSGYRVHRVASEADFLGPVLTENTMMEQRHFDLFCVPKDRSL